jgi:hypothetical protein
MAKHELAKIFVSGNQPPARGFATLLENDIISNTWLQVSHVPNLVILRTKTFDDSKVDAFIRKESQRDADPTG